MTEDDAGKLCTVFASLREEILISRACSAANAAKFGYTWAPEYIDVTTLSDPFVEPIVVVRYHCATKGDDT